MGNGYWEKVLRVDLSNRTAKEESVGVDVWKKIIGGAGFGLR